MAVIQKAKLTAYSASIFRAWEGGTIRLNEIGIFSLPQADWFSILRQKWRRIENQSACGRLKIPI
ncbi:hypothetical protein, partial [Mesorhizobium sp. M7A.F.Ca.CA.004.04.1.1]|uniref:hypothetical protein n=1 Tax=Mesorhizobium sp. M7A.F.Ca.CA.004.04.1.1 TaxID=2496733 RepID=UPI0019D255FF